MAEEPLVIVHKDRLHGNGSAASATNDALTQDAAALGYEPEEATSSSWAATDEMAAEPMSTTGRHGRETYAPQKTTKAGESGARSGSRFRAGRRDMDNQRAAEQQRPESAPGAPYQGHAAQQVSDSRERRHSSRSPRELEEDIRRTREHIDAIVGMLTSKAVPTASLPSDFEPDYLTLGKNIIEFGGSMISNLQEIGEFVKKHPIVPAMMGLGVAVNVLVGRLFGNTKQEDEAMAYEKERNNMTSGRHPSEAAPRSVSGMHQGYEPHPPTILKSRNTQIAMGALGLAVGISGLYLATRAIKKSRG